MTQSIAPKTGDRLILRGADGYDEARFARVFNARRPERYPAAVLVAESEGDEDSDRRCMGASAADPREARPERPVRRLPRRPRWFP